MDQFPDKFDYEENFLQWHFLFLGDFVQEGLTLPSKNIKQMKNEYIFNSR